MSELSPNLNSTLRLLNECILQVTTLFKWFLATGKIPAFLILCTLVPMLKDNLDDIATSDNLRAIAIGSLILKWFDWLIFILNSDKLTTDEQGRKGQPQQFLVRATFSSFSRPSHLEILVLRLFCVLKFLILEDKTIFFKSGHVWA